MSIKAALPGCLISFLTLVLTLTACTDNASPTPIPDTATSIPATPTIVSATATVSAITIPTVIIPTVTPTASVVTVINEPTRRPYNPKIIATTDGGINWNIVYSINSNNSSYPYTRLDNIKCPTSTTCYAGGYNYLIATNDGGKSWRSLSSTNGGITHCPNITTCFAISSSGGPFYLTSDSGKTWNTITHKLDGFIRDINCPAVTVCIAVGTDDVILGTIDGGNTWEQQHSETGGSFSSVSCPSTTTCFAAAFITFANAAGIIVNTTDGGKNWNKRFQDWSIGRLNSISCATSNFCVAISFQSILSTTNGGKSWTTYNLGRDTLPENISCPTINFCMAVGYRGTILVTNDGGNTWNLRIPSFIDRDYEIVKVSCPEANVCYATLVE